MQTPERHDLVAGGKGMLLDTKVLHGFRNRGEVYRFQSQEELELDVTEIMPAEAARKIMEHVQMLLQESKTTAERATPQ